MFPTKYPTDEIPPIQFFQNHGNIHRFHLRTEVRYREFTNGFKPNQPNSCSKSDRREHRRIECPLYTYREKHHERKQQSRKIIRKIDCRIPPNKNPQRDSIWLSKFIDLLDKYHQQERSVEFYAEKLFITPKYLSTVIKRTSGYNATNWINRYVILEAQSLLKYSDKSIQEIADCLNFSNASFFGKYFKRHTGMTPGEYKAAL